MYDKVPINLWSKIYLPFFRFYTLFISFLLGTAMFDIWLKLTNKITDKITPQRILGLETDASDLTENKHTLSLKNEQEKS